MSVPRLGLKAIASDSGLTFARQLIAAVFQLCTVAVIAQSFGPSGNGIYAVSLIIPAALTALLNFGVAPANTYYLSSGKSSLRSVASAMAALATASSILGLAIGVAVIHLYSGALFPELPTLGLYAALSAFPFSLAQTLLASIFRGLRDYKTFNAMLLLTPTVTAVWVTSVVLSGISSIELTILGYTFGMAAAALMGTIKLYKSLPPKSDEPTSASFIPRALKFGYKAHIGELINILIYKSDIFLLNLLMGNSSAGMYTIAVQITERLWIISRAVSTVALPELSARQANQALREALTPVLSRVVIFQTLIGGCFVALAGYYLIPPIFGQEYGASFYPLLILLPGVIAWAGARVMAADIYARGKPEMNMYLVAITAILNVAGNLTLIPVYGLIGAAVATSLSYAVYMLMNAYVISRWSNIAVHEFLLVGRADYRRLVGIFRRR